MSGAATGGTPGGMSATRLALLARRARKDGLPALLREPIAVIGMGCRFPGGANSPEQFWKLLLQSFDGVSEARADRWSIDEWYDPDPATPGRTSVRHGGFLEGVADFDAAFFGISPREAERMDPHQRLALEVAWEALEDAGLPLHAVYEQPVGVFAASYNNDYVLHQYLRPDSINERTITGVVHSIVANRISYYLGLVGPSLTIDTACSSSLVTVHLACQTLRAGGCDVALAGGVSLMLRAEPFVAMSKAGFMAPDGRCKTFDARADGFGRGEGCGFIVLKRLSDALAAGDRIDAVIRGTAVNQDGRSTVLAAPNGRSQVEVVRAALADAQLDPGSVSYIEAHGTGTRLGDPIEVESLAEALGPARAGRRAIASVKANIGHLEAAAGIAGIIKAVLCLRHLELPPQVQFERENPLLDLAGHGFEIPLRARAWAPVDGIHAAGVSSFGVGGTNAHVVLEAAPALPETRQQSEQGSTLLVLSARTPAARVALAARYAAMFDEVEDTPVVAQRLSAAAALHRTSMEERMAVVGSTPRELAARLRAGAAVHPAEVRVGRADAESPRRIVFVFNGQGSQWPGMGVQLMSEEPVFRNALEEVDALFAPLAGWSLFDALEGRPVPYTLDDTACAQPLIFAVQVALARLLEHWDIKPTAVVGHSIGELAAACASGHLTLAEAVPMVFHRARVMQQASPDGAMLAARLDAADAQAALTQHEAVALAGLNGPRSVVFSGQRDDVARLEGELVARGVQVRALTVRYGFHSRQMQPLEAELRAALETPAVARPQATLISTVTGEAMPPGAFDPAYVARNVVSPVRFHGAICAAIRSGGNAFIEIGPRAVLGTNLLETLEAESHEAVVTAAVTQRDPGRAGLLSALGALYCAGAEPAWQRVLGSAPADPALPTYAWQHERFWLEGAEHTRADTMRADCLAGTRLESPAIVGAIFHRTLTATMDGLADHRIGGQCLVPAAMMLEMARVAGEDLTGGPVTVEGAEFLRPVLVTDAPRQAQLWVRPDADAHIAELHTRADGAAWVLAFRCALTPDVEGAGTALSARDAKAALDASRIGSTSIDDEARAWPRTVAVPEFYALAAARGCDFGPAFRNVDALSLDDGVALARLRAVEHQSPDRAGAFAPALLDAALQPAIALLDTPDLHVPAGVGVYRRVRPGVPVASRVREVAATDAGTRRFDVALLDAQGAVVAAVEGLVLRPAPAGFAELADPSSNMYAVRWVPQDVPLATPDALASAHWIVVGDSEFAAAMYTRLKSEGAQVIAAADVPRALAELGARSEQQASRAWVICCEQKPALPDAAPQELLDGAYALAEPVLQLTPTLSEGAGDRVLLLSRGMQVVDGAASRPRETEQPPAAADRVAPWGATLAGLTRAIRSEYADVHCTLVDLDESDAVADDLVAQCLGAVFTRDSVLARRDGRWLAPRIERVVVEPSADARQKRDAIDVLALSTPGDLDSIRVRSAQRRAPARDEVEIAVRWGALNFRDVLGGLGIVSTRLTHALGHECAGVVVAVGTDVDDLAPGDEVLALAEGAFGEYVTCRRSRAFVRPALGWAESATLPIAYLTAYHALVHVAAVQPGQRVLVHNGAGGVGIAAVRLAMSRGAVVFATAGSPEKRAFLTNLGVALTADSRSTAFRNEILTATDGAGVDVVVNALTGEAIDAGLSLLRAGGCFIELGKRDIREPGNVAAAYPGVRYAAFDLFDELDRDPAPQAAAFAELTRGVVSGELAPLPYVTFPSDRATDAYRLMARAGHTGKILLSFRQHYERAPGIRGDATYLITGGTGAVGLDSAEWLVSRGARAIALASRHAPADAALERIEALRAAGAEIMWSAVDLLDEDAVRSLIERTGTTERPLRGVVHAAGQLADGVLTDQDPTRFVVPFGPKVIGALHVARCLDPRALDFLLLYSAAGSLLDPAGQANYAAANAVTDAFAEQLRAAGYPATSVAWGLWHGGMAARLDPAQVGRWHRQGLRPIGVDLAGLLLDRVIAADRGMLIPVAIDWARYFAERADADPLFDDLRTTGSVTGAAPDAAERLRSQPGHRQRAALREYLIEVVGRVLGRADLIEAGAERPLRDLGLDSLMAVELRNMLTRELGHPFSATLAFDYPDIPALVDHIGGVLFTPASSVQESRVRGNGAHTEEMAAVRREFDDGIDIAELSEEEAERQLLEELRELGAQVQEVTP